LRAFEPPSRSEQLPQRGHLVRVHSFMVPGTAVQRTIYRLSAGDFEGVAAAPGGAGRPGLFRRRPAAMARGAAIRPRGGHGPKGAAVGWQNPRTLAGARAGWAGP